MSYQVIVVYSFRCDMCDVTFSCNPADEHAAGRTGMLT